MRSLKNLEKRKILRIVDANLNRSREGLRVCEDIVRFLLDDESMARKLKRIRQNIFSVINKSGLEYTQLLKMRDSVNDVGKTSTKKEKQRDSWQSVFLANIERAKESTRTLEEVSKLIDKKLAESFKKIRFSIYDTEKKIIIKHQTLSGGKRN